MDLTEYRKSKHEVSRKETLLRSFPTDCSNVLEIGSRDGFYTKVLAGIYDEVTALDLEKPSINLPNVTCTAGDITNLQFDDNSFDMIICTQVLEHIPSQLLNSACKELSRVTRKYIFIGVPFEQDIRYGKTTCSICNRVNPPWGHVNSFTESSLLTHFKGLSVVRKEFFHTKTARTNFLSSAFMTAAGNPWGTYNQEEACIHCGGVIAPGNTRTIPRRIFARLAVMTERIYDHIVPPRETPLNIHVLFLKQSFGSAGSGT